MKKILRFVKENCHKKVFDLHHSFFFGKSPLNSKLLFVVCLYMRGGIIHKQLRAFLNTRPISKRWVVVKHTSYQSPPPPPAMVYFFQAGALFCTENAKFLPMQANLGYFVANLRTFWCPFYWPKQCGGAQKTGIRYGVLSLLKFD